MNVLKFYETAHDMTMCPRIFEAGALRSLKENAKASGDSLAKSLREAKLMRDELNTYIADMEFHVKWLTGDAPLLKGHVRLSPSIKTVDAWGLNPLQYSDVAAWNIEGHEPLCFVEKYHGFGNASYYVANKNSNRIARLKGDTLEQAEYSLTRFFYEGRDLELLKED